jgi:tetratricopeptide (TPR) repeat protein
MTIDDIQDAIKAAQTDNLMPGRKILLPKPWKTETEPPLLATLAELARAVGELDNQVLILRRLVEVTPDQPENHFTLGIALRQKGYKKEGRKHLGKAYKGNQQHPDIAYVWCQALEEDQQYEAALRVAERANDHFTDQADWLSLTGDLLTHLGRLREAVQHYNRALRLQPGDPAISFNASQAVFQLGQWGDAWTLYDYRLILRDPATRPNTTAKLWSVGESIKGKTILVWQEQGFGDAIMMLRFLPILTEEGAKVHVLLNGQLTDLVASQYPEITVHNQRQPPPKTDLQIPIMSIPRRLGLEHPDQLTGEAYLSVEPSDLLPKGTTKKAGLVWAGNPNHPDDARRSLSPALFEPLLDLPGYSWYSFQIGRHEWAEEHPQVTDLRPQLKTFQQTAEYLSQMDLVISVDTAVAHLAGALGISVHLLLDYAPDWRWPRTGTTTTWYEKHRIWRQETPGDWEEVVERMSILRIDGD